MKKIISVLALSTLVFGSAAAKTSVNLNYRNGAALWSYADNGESQDPVFGTDARKSMGFFNLDKYQGGNDNLTLNASGDILSYSMVLAPDVTNKQNNDQIGVTRIQLGAQWGAFGVLAGLNKDGITAGFNVKKDVDAASYEGSIGQKFKLGSTFAESYAQYSDNQVNIGGSAVKGRKAGSVVWSDRTFFTQAKFNIAVPNSDAQFDLIGTVILPNGWDKTGNTKAENYGHFAWTAFAVFSKPGVFKAEAFLKSNPHCNVAGHADHEQIFVPGAYFQFLAVPGLETTFGASANIVEYDLEDFNFDLRARYATGPLSITYFGNISAVAGNWDKVGARTVNLPGMYSFEGSYYTAGSDGNGADAVFSGTGAIKTHLAMWNWLNARFKINDTFTAMAAVSSLTDLANGINQGPQKAEGTTLSITPAVQIYASSKAFVWIGFNATMQGIGKEEHPVNRAYPENKSSGNNFDATFTQQGLDLAFTVPVLFRVQL